MSAHVLLDLAIKEMIKRDKMRVFVDHYMTLPQRV